METVILEKATHPGIFLKQELKARKIKRKHFAEMSHISIVKLSGILTCRYAIHAHLALIFEEVLGIDAEFWMNLQTTYDLDIARVNKEEAISKVKTRL